MVLLSDSRRSDGVVNPPARVSRLCILRTFIGLLL